MMRWKDNIEKGVREIGFIGLNWIELAQSRVQWWDFVVSMVDLQVLL
jgi:predicted small integral membrane protein